MAVFLFFALSGFWVNRMWRERYSQCRSPTSTFLISRLWRLLPALWLATLLTLAIMWASGQLPAFASELSPAEWPRMLFANLAILGCGSLPHADRLLDTAWSLDVELQFYLAVPLLMCLSARTRSLLVATVGIVGLGLLLAYGEPIHRHLGYYATFFGPGMAVEQTRWRPSPRLASMSLVGAAAVAVAALAMPATRDLFTASGHAVTELYRWNYAANCLLALLLMPFAFSTVYRRSSGTDRMFGDLSYLVYLFHLPLVGLLGSGFGTLPLAERLAGLAALWIATFGLSLFVWRYLHRPLERGRHAFVASRGRHAGVFAGTWGGHIAVTSKLVPAVLQRRA